MFPNSSDAAPTGDTRKHFRMVVAYDGTDFFGWQVQPRLPTIQGAMADAVRSITGEAVLPQGSGRTDTGVHAEGQTVSLTLRSRIPAERLHRALNQRLPPAIRVRLLEEAPAGFHARSGVLHKMYEYRIFQRRHGAGPAGHVCPPHLARYAWDCPWPLQVEPMQQAAAECIGTHDFSAFAASDSDRVRQAEALGLPVDNTRTIFHSAWDGQGDLLRYRVSGSGFLHHMVRNLVGTMVEIGTGRMPPDCMPAILQARQRSGAGPTAPPQGLHLVEVVYAGDQTCLTGTAV